MKILKFAEGALVLFQLYCLYVLFGIFKYDLPFSLWMITWGLVMIMFLLLFISIRNFVFEW